MFSRVCLILFTGVCIPTMSWEGRPPKSRPPTTEGRPPSEGRSPLRRQTSIRRQTPTPWMWILLRDMVNKRAVCVLLECIIVSKESFKCWCCEFFIQFYIVGIVPSKCNSSILHSFTFYCPSK